MVDVDVIITILITTSTRCKPIDYL